jgi:glucoamylase
MTIAPGAPGITPRWTSSAKAGLGTALSPRSAVWFTHSHGILNEIYYPAVDRACTRDCGLIVTDGTAGGFFAEEKRDTISTTRRIADGVPAFVITNICKQNRFTIEKRIVADPMYDSVLQHITFTPAPGVTGLRLFVLLAPHLVNGGAHNTGWTGDYKGAPMLFASGDGTSLALACATGFSATSVGFAGSSDGWQILRRDGYLSETYDQAPNGNIALTAELSLDAPILLAIGFGVGISAPRGMSRRTGSTGKARCNRWIQCIKPRRITSTGSAPPCCAAMKARFFPVAPSPAFPFPGVLPRAMTIWAAIIWSGRGI